MRVLSVVLLMVLVLAGCVGGPSLQAPPILTADYDADTGAIDGIVVDPEYQPIEGAKVMIVGTNITTNSTAEGRFVVNHLVPQLYLAIVSKQGFKESKVGFDVPAGNVTRPRVVLDPIPPPTPHVNIANTFNGAIRLGYAYRATGVSGNSSGSQGSVVPESFRTTPSYHLRPEGHWQTLLFEIDWKPSSDQSDELAMQVTWAEKATNGGTSLVNKQWVVGGEPPLRWRLERSTYDQMREANPKLLVGLNYGLPFQIGTSTDPSQPVDVGFYPDQKYSVFVSIGYYGPIPADHTRLPK